MQYPRNYGSWAGNPTGTPPDYSRCAAEVGGAEWKAGRQCPNPPKYDQGESGNPTACGKHRDKSKIAAEHPPVPIEATSKAFTVYQATAKCPMDGCKYVARSADSSRRAWAQTSALNDLGAHLRGKHNRRPQRPADEQLPSMCR